MLVLITYDVNTQTPSGRGRLRRIAKECVNKGQRVQNSVFECLLDYGELVSLRSTLLSIMDDKTDSLRIYYLGDRYKTKIENYGANQTYNPEGTLII
jgi:CRISPR-associated protein Cas2